MQRAPDREQPLRLTRPLHLIDRAALERHRHRISFIRTRIVKLAINQNCDRD